MARNHEIISLIFVNTQTNNKKDIPFGTKIPLPSENSLRRVIQSVGLTIDMILNQLKISWFITFQKKNKR